MRPPLKIRDGPVLVRWFNLVDGSKGGGIDAGGPQKVILFDNLSLTCLAAESSRPISHLPSGPTILLWSWKPMVKRFYKGPDPSQEPS